MRIEWATSPQITALICCSLDFRPADREQLVKTVKEATIGKQVAIIVDMAEVVLKNMESDIELLLDAFEQIRGILEPLGKRTALCIQEPEVWAAFNQSDLKDFVPIYANRDKAKQALVKGGESMANLATQQRHRTQEAVDAVLDRQTQGPVGYSQKGAPTVCGAQDCAFYLEKQGMPHCTHDTPKYVNQRGRCPLFMLNWADNKQNSEDAPGSSGTDAASDATSDATSDAPAPVAKSRLDIIRELALMDERKIADEAKDTERRKRLTEQRGIVLTAPTAEELAAVGLTGQSSRSPKAPKAADQPLSMRLGRPVSDDQQGNTLQASDTARLPAGVKRSASPPSSGPTQPLPRTPAATGPVQAGPAPSSQHGPQPPRSTRPAKVVRAFIEAWNRKDWQTEYTCLAQPLRGYPLDTYANMREAAANKLRATKTCATHVLDHVVEEMISPTEARVAVRRSDYLGDKKLRTYQQIFWLTGNGDHWEITNVRDIRSSGPMPPERKK